MAVNVEVNSMLCRYRHVEVNSVLCQYLLTNHATRLVLRQPLASLHSLFSTSGFPTSLRDNMIRPLWGRAAALGVLLL